jgi:hypothetical protein
MIRRPEVPVQRKFCDMCHCHYIAQGSLCAVSIALGLFLAVVVTQAQHTPPPSNSPVRPTSLVSDINKGHTGQSVRFGRHTAHVGDRVEQEIALAMRLATSLRQGNRLVEQKQTTMRTSQHRIVTTTEVSAGRATSVVVEYLSASSQTSVGDASSAGLSDSTAAGSARTTEQPVHGKTYRCRREGEKDGKLLVTDRSGNAPPQDEYEIVSQNMEMIGRANPLAEFLAERKIALGETLKLPQEAADRLFNLGDRFGSVNRFELTLRRTLVDGGTPCAEFWARVDAASNDSSQMRLQVEGPLVIQIDTCRAVRSELSGPIGLSESRGSYGSVNYLLGTGQLSMHIASVYVAPKR